MKWVIPRRLRSRPELSSPADCGGLIEVSRCVRAAPMPRRGLPPQIAGASLKCEFAHGASDGARRLPPQIAGASLKCQSGDEVRRGGAVFPRRLRGPH